MATNVLGQLGEWVSPTGERIPILEKSIQTNFQINVVASLDGMVLPIDVAFSTAVSQRDYWRKVAEDARTKLADLQAGEPPAP
jgi:hypothetical protein